MKGNWMGESLSKPPGEKCVMTGWSLVEGCTSKVTLEMFNQSEEDIVLHKNTHTALVDPFDIEITEQQDEELREKEKSSVRAVTKREPLPEELQRVCKNTQYDLSREEKNSCLDCCMDLREFFSLKENHLGEHN